jgi:formylglycine-generating enzyme required for sulfatase activity
VATRLAPVDQMVQVLVPAGLFTIGSRLETNAGYIVPRTVNLEPFWIDPTEVTAGQYVVFLNLKGNILEGGVRWIQLSGSPIRQVGGIFTAVTGLENHPVQFVSWYGAAAYCEWVERRLPTEAEWEKAARGLGEGPYPWGADEPTCAMANYGNCLGQTTAVGSYAADVSPYGVLDMFGNVREWTADWYDSAYWDSAPVNNPAGPASGDLKMVRGGSWELSERSGRVFSRSAVHRGYQWNIGFRCVQDAQ